MQVEIREADFDPYAELLQYQTKMQQGGQYGATTIFVGSMRDFNEGDEVKAMVLEHYPKMTENFLLQISQEAAEKWSILDSLIIHRVGEVHPADPIVLVAVWSAHRKDAYEANRYIMEALKSKAPFWKKEFLEKGERWVQQNTPGR
ncbi:MAG: molybdenum cofactor biosynthesis protein MoaE [Gammaproteobacteria bacterium]|nr:molybdenum cofactor biosynthesis protein MoaE [Gammaproteobacteria bacterium]